MIKVFRNLQINFQVKFSVSVIIVGIYEEQIKFALF